MVLVYERLMTLHITSHWLSRPYRYLCYIINYHHCNVQARIDDYLPPPLGSSRYAITNQNHWSDIRKKTIKFNFSFTLGAQLENTNMLIISR